MAVCHAGATGLRLADWVGWVAAGGVVDIRASSAAGLWDGNTNGSRRGFPSIVRLTLEWMVGRAPRFPGLQNRETFGIHSLFSKRFAKRGPSNRPSRADARACGHARGGKCGECLDWWPARAAALHAFPGFHPGYFRVASDGAFCVMVGCGAGRIRNSCGNDRKKGKDEDKNKSHLRCRTCVAGSSRSGREMAGVQWLINGAARRPLDPSAWRGGRECKTRTARQMPIRRWQ